MCNDLTMKPLRPHPIRGDSAQRVFSRVLTIVIGLSFSFGAAAQERADGRPGTMAAVGYEYTAIGDGRDDWQARSIRAGVDPAWGFVAMEFRRSERFDLADDIVVLDGWVDAAHGWYGNSRIALAPGADAHPTLDALAEYFRTLPGGWEPAIQGRIMRYPGTDVFIAGLAVGRYVGRWYLRAQGVVGDDGKSRNPSLAVSGRWYVRESDRYVEGRFVVGREVLSTGRDGLLESAGTRAILFRTNWAVHGPWSLGLSGSWQDDRALGRRFGGAAEIVARL